MSSGKFRSWRPGGDGEARRWRELRGVAGGSADEGERRPSLLRPSQPSWISNASSRRHDGLHFEPEPGIRLAPREELPHLCIRALCADIVELEDGRWRIYFEARGGRQPYVVCSAISSDMLHWELEEGIRLQPPGGAGGPRYLSLPDGRSRLYYCTAPKLADGSSAKSVASAVSDDGLHFETEPDFRLRWEDAGDNPSGITTAEVIPPKKVVDKLERVAR